MACIEYNFDSRKEYFQGHLVLGGIGSERVGEKEWKTAGEKGISGLYIYKKCESVSNLNSSSRSCGLWYICGRGWFS